MIFVILCRSGYSSDTGDVLPSEKGNALEGMPELLVHERRNGSEEDTYSAVPVL